MPHKGRGPLEQRIRESMNLPPREKVKHSYATATPARQAIIDEYGSAFKYKKAMGLTKPRTPATTAPVRTQESKPRRPRKRKDVGALY